MWHYSKGQHSLTRKCPVIGSYKRKRDWIETTPCLWTGKCNVTEEPRQLWRTAGGLALPMLGLVLSLSELREWDGSTVRGGLQKLSPCVNRNWAYDRGAIRHWRGKASGLCVLGRHLLSLWRIKGDQLYVTQSTHSNIPRVTGQIVKGSK